MKFAEKSEIFSSPYTCKAPKARKMNCLTLFAYLALTYRPHSLRVVCQWQIFWHLACSEPVEQWNCQFNGTPCLIRCKGEARTPKSHFQIAAKSALIPINDNWLFTIFSIIIPDAHGLRIIVTKIISRSNMQPIFCRDMTAVNKWPHLNLEHWGQKQVNNLPQVLWRNCFL